MAFRTLLRTLLFVCALFLVDNDARAQTSEIPLSSSPFSLVGPFFQDMEVKAREG